MIGVEMVSKANREKRRYRSLSKKERKLIVIYLIITLFLMVYCLTYVLWPIFNDEIIAYYNYYGSLITIGSHIVGVIISAMFSIYLIKVLIRNQEITIKMSGKEKKNYKKSEEYFIKLPWW